MQITLVMHAEVDLEPGPAVRMGPVLDPLGNQRLIRNQVLHAIARHDRNVPAAECRHPAVGSRDGDDVAGLDRLVDEQDDAADQVGDHLLQAEADADADRAAEHGERRQVDAHRRDRDDDREPNENDLQRLDEKNLQRRRECPNRLDPGLEKPREIHRNR